MKQSELLKQIKPKYLNKKGRKKLTKIKQKEFDDEMDSYQWQSDLANRVLPDTKNVHIPFDRYYCDGELYYGNPRTVDGPKIKIDVKPIDDSKVFYADDVQELLKKMEDTMKGYMDDDNPKLI